ncbi:hypothetical protein Tco_0432402 [Tanacetum coccineum]
MYVGRKLNYIDKINVDLFNVDELHMFLQDLGGKLKVVEVIVEYWLTSGDHQYLSPFKSTVEIEELDDDDVLLNAPVVGSSKRLALVPGRKFWKKSQMPSRLIPPYIPPRGHNKRSCKGTSVAGSGSASGAATQPAMAFASASTSAKQPQRQPQRAASQPASASACAPKPTRKTKTKNVAAIGSHGGMVQRSQQSRAKDKKLHG